MAHETVIVVLLKTGSVLWLLIARQSVPPWNSLILASSFAAPFLVKYSVFVIDWRAPWLLDSRLLLLFLTY